MKSFILKLGILGLLSACQTKSHEEAFREHLNSLQLTFKMPYKTDTSKVRVDTSFLNQDLVVKQ